MENRRLLLAAFLSFLIVVLWNFMFPPTLPEPPEPQVREAPLEEAAETEREVIGSEDPSSGEEEVRESPEPQVPAEPLEEIAASAEKMVVLSNERVRATFSNRGAQLVSLQLLQELTSEGDPIEMVRDRGTDPYPFSLVVDGTRSHRLNRALFTSEPSSGAEGDQVRFRHRSASGDATKTFSLDSRGFLQVSVEVANQRHWSLVLGPGLRNLDSKEADNRYLLRNVGYRKAGSVELSAPGDLEEDLFVSGAGLSWVSLEDNFFLFAAVPRQGVGEVVIRPVVQRMEVVEGEPRFLPMGSDPGDEELVESQLILLNSSGERMELEAYAGAKRYSTLLQLPHGLEETVHWGFLGFLAKPLYFGLEWIYQEVVSNYGWAIIIITFIIRLVFLPLTYKSQESMTKMQELNPKIQAIRNKYRSKMKDKQGRPNLDAQRQMNDEVMTIYKQAGVNPASGCLPVLLQMPVFFALYKLLSTAVELRNAPWILWIQDLSASDPKWILPLVMGATSVLTQKMMPSVADPVQKKILQLMPIMFTVFAFTFPSGLVLYWATNNVLTMLQHVLITKMKKTPAPA